MAGTSASPPIAAALEAAFAGDDFELIREVPAHGAHDQSAGSAVTLIDCHPFSSEFWPDSLRIGMAGGAKRFDRMEPPLPDTRRGCAFQNACSSLLLPRWQPVISLPIKRGVCPFKPADFGGIWTFPVLAT